jgi:hypothetical protein
VISVSEAQAGRRMEKKERRSEGMHG